jgi:hypothetical protein
VLKISRWKPIGSNISNPTFAMFNTSLLGGRYGEAEPEKGLFPDIPTSVGLLMPHPSGLPWNIDGDARRTRQAGESQACFRKKWGWTQRYAASMMVWVR